MLLTPTISTPQNLAVHSPIFFFFYLKDSQFPDSVKSVESPKGWSCNLECPFRPSDLILGCLFRPTYVSLAALHWGCKHASTPPHFASGALLEKTQIMVWLLLQHQPPNLTQSFTLRRNIQGGFVQIAPCWAWPKPRHTGYISGFLRGRNGILYLIKLGNIIGYKYLKCKFFPDNFASSLRVIVIFQWWEGQQTPPPPSLQVIGSLFKLYIHVHLGHCVTHLKGQVISNGSQVTFIMCQITRSHFKSAFGRRSQNTSLNRTKIF